MKAHRCVIWLIAFVSFTQTVAQNIGNPTMPYIIQRGEDIETVAAKYGITADELRKYNPEFDAFFSGMEIKVPRATTFGNIAYGIQPHVGNANTSATKPMAASPYGNILVEAQKEQADGDYKKAAKLYSKIIESNQGSTDWNIYLARGYCQYQRGKYKSAIKDLESALNDGQCLGSDRDMVSDFLEYAQAKREEQLSRRGELWGSIIGTTALIGANAYAASQSAKAPGNNSAGTWAAAPRKNLGSMSDAEFNAYINQNMQQIWQQTQLQVQTQFAQEKAQVNNNFIQTYRQLNGKAPSEWEIQQNYNSYMQTRINAANAVSRAGAYGSSDSDETKSSANNGTGRVTGNKHECSMCHGTGRIGKETHPANFGYEDNTKIKCNECGGVFLRSSGHVHESCPVCHGEKYL